MYTEYELTGNVDRIINCYKYDTIDARVELGNDDYSTLFTWKIFEKKITQIAREKSTISSEKELTK